MKRIFGIIISAIIIAIATIPICALGSPVTDGAYNLPPTSSRYSYGANYSIMRSYANVSTVYVHSSTQTASAVYNGNNVNWYPAFMVSTPDVMVAPSADGFGRAQNYSSTSLYSSRYTLNSVTGLDSTFASVPIAQNPILYSRHPSGNAIVYSYVYDDAVDTAAIQYGVITGEWGDGTSIDNIITGYSIQWTGYGEAVLSVKGQLVYGSDGGNKFSFNIDRQYTLSELSIFSFNPQSLMQYEDTINFDYYVFSGNWTIDADNNGTLREYKAYDSTNVETVNYNASVNEYELQQYSIDLYPVARISSKLSQIGSSGGSTPDGTLTVHSAGVHDVTNYQYIDVDIPPFSLYYNGDINNGTYEHEQMWQGVDIDILMDIGNTFERGSSVDISSNGDTNVGRYEFANVDVPQTVIDDVNAFDWLFGAVNGFLSMEILPDFSIGGILLFAAGLALLIWILKIFLGG